MSSTSNLAKIAAEICPADLNDRNVVRGRFAPSPTGYIHLGNAWSFLVCWLAARKEHGKLVLRIEDIDPDRSKPEYVDGLIEDLHWLGLDWDEGADIGGNYAPYTQSESTGLYERVIEALQQDGLVYPCFCTRKELRSLASAPHKGDYGTAYPELCLNLSIEERSQREAEGRRSSMRLHCAKDQINFTDVLHGECCMSWKDCGGDFPLRRSDGVFAYQLAVVVDDIRQRITQIVRGEDILHCTPRQVYLYELLGCPPPEYIHLPLVVDYEGERLAKRHGHFELRKMREAGISAEAIVGYLAHLGGLLPVCQTIDARELLEHFSIDKINTKVLQLEKDVIARLKELSGVADLV
ncbi:tRNA glutamyl-Q(34) synthetase GluQRS [Halodesulfovibrio marinisediminis]|uniref:Glutamyl-Q tRNA(Asp) synthetase n=1 Tax=Halodesulfovibrio marinisediminis DSM 17456 TaxID=1121457 RepID=A0A1N6E1I9_9BACT|nr:tRNA glutamyl-Q(34) synthetase GluQRS [Halodesulfovibrio marinisediminis]SIN76876.1 glutamyl-tRNA synthetase [Halodesulfovibrio marinisediminis DSM 17456]